MLAQVLANGPPAAVVAAFLVAFLDTDTAYVVRNVTVLAIYGTVGFVVLVGLGRVHLPREFRWPREGRPPTERERDRLLLRRWAGCGLRVRVDAPRGGVHADQPPRVGG